MVNIQLVFKSTAECGASAVTFQDNTNQLIYQTDLDDIPLWSANTSAIALFNTTINTDLVIASSIIGLSY